MTQDSPSQHTKLLSFHGDILTFQCKLSNPRDGESRRGSELAFSRLTFQRDGCTFSKGNGGMAVINRKSSSDVDIVACAFALHVKNRVTSPCILLIQSKKGDVFKYSLLTLSSSNRLEPHMEFKLPYRMKDNVTILQGPTVLWSYEGIVFYTSLQAGEVRQIPIKLSLNFIGEFPLNKRKIFILGSQTQSKECLKDQLDAPGGSKTLGYFVEDGQVLNAALILPHAYSSITQCVFVISAEEVNSVLKSTVVAATSKKQLVYFENGIPREVCLLPFEEPQHIQMVNTGRNGCLFAISFNHGHVCAVWKDTFQVASCWSGVSSLHVDDFLGCGTDQMLLVFGSQSPPVGPVDLFLITDLCGTTYSHGQESSEGQQASDTAQENYLLTVQALQSRLQSGLTLLQDLQRDVRVKERVLRQSVQALTDMVSGREHILTQTEQEGLVSLWDDEPEDEAMHEKMQVMPVVPPPLVDKLWHRVIEDRLIVGVILTTESAISAESVTLSILREGGRSRAPAVIQTHSQASWFPTPRPPSPCSHPEPAAKRSRRDYASASGARDTRRLAVTAVTDLTPLLTSGSVKCPIMLHYVHRQGSSASVTAPGPTVVQCGQVLVDIQVKHHPQLMTNSQLTTDEAREDLLSLLAVLDAWTFLIHSPDHTLCDVAGWIQTSMPCERLEISPHYLLANPAGPSAAMLFHWQHKTPFQGELSVHCSQFKVLQFLDSLCGFLPASCSILPLRQGGGDGTAPRLAHSLEKEVLSLKQGLSSLFRGEEEMEEGKKIEPPDPGSAEGLQRCREEWQRDRERSRRLLSPLVGVDRYRRLTQSLAQVQLEGDVAALLETQTHTLI
ncbi:Fanconi anemia group B protein [Coregonus clupeaformis]|uniref:Fanconi anemia group B protein n=1 Tax=Coregonus clupeaformis TaxID=59861 RepID=UPI001BE0FB8A|nr:Fanconi anemia group B protein [Coregonus clupeaformis]